MGKVKNLHFCKFNLMVNLTDKLIFKPQLLDKNNIRLLKDLETDLKSYYNIGKSFELKKTGIKTLTIKRCDIEQIWRQLYLNANFFLKRNINNVSFNFFCKLLILFSLKLIDL